MESNYNKIREIDMGELSVFEDRKLIPFKYILAVGKLQKEGKEPNNKTVANKMGVSPKTAKTRGKKLQKSGLVLVNEGQKDQESTIHDLTDKGKNYLSKLKMIKGREDQFAVEKLENLIIEELRKLWDLDKSEYDDSLKPSNFDLKTERYDKIRKAVAQSGGFNPENNDYRDKYAYVFKKLKDDASDDEEYDVYGA